jgi:hypothetical protein
MARKTVRVERTSTVGMFSRSSKCRRCGCGVVDGQTKKKRFQPNRISKSSSQCKSSVALRSVSTPTNLHEDQQESKK